MEIPFKVDGNFASQGWELDLKSLQRTSTNLSVDSYYVVSIQENNSFG